MSIPPEPPAPPGVDLPHRATFITDLDKIRDALALPPTVRLLTARHDPFTGRVELLAEGPMFPEHHPGSSPEAFWLARIGDLVDRPARGLAAVPTPAPDDTSP